MLDISRAHILRMAFIIVFGTSILSSSDEPVRPHPEDPATIARHATRAEHLRWFRDAKYGLFIHWGLYSIPGGEWKGVTTRGLGEWIMLRARIPIAEYATLATQFNPTQFDAEAWAQLAEDSGMRYLVITAKHHDGFAMYHSTVSAYNVVDATPFKRDPLKELAEAARRHHLRIGFYYSQSQDWHEPNGIGNSWDFSPDSHNFQTYLDAKVIPQITELATNYGPLGTMWFDTPREMTEDSAAHIEQLVHRLQPTCLLSGRLGPGDASDYESVSDNRAPQHVTAGAWEMPGTMNNTWGYRKDDKDWKSPRMILFNLVDVVSKGGNYLLNIGPTGDGVIPAPSLDILRAVGKWLKVNGEAIYGASPSPFGAEFGSFSNQVDARGKPAFTPLERWRCTAKPGKLYFHLFRWADPEFHMQGVTGKVSKAYLLADPVHTPLFFIQKDDDLTITVPPEQPDQLTRVVAVEIETPDQKPKATSDQHGF